MQNPSKKASAKSVDYAVRQLLLEGRVGTQEAICKALEKQGYSVNQTKVSRLLTKIGAIKVTNPEGENIYRLPHEHGLAHEFRSVPAKGSSHQSVIDVVSNESFIVIHTIPGAASMVAREIDLHQLELQTLGTIAGDDTIFVAPKELKKIRQVLENIKNLLLV